MFSFADAEGAVLLRCHALARLRRLRMPYDTRRSRSSTTSALLIDMPYAAFFAALPLSLLMILPLFRCRRRLPPATLLSRRYDISATDDDTGEGDAMLVTEGGEWLVGYAS